MGARYMLLATHRETDLVVHTGVPTIRYKLDRERVHFPDILVLSENKLIEVKSTYTYFKDQPKNDAKKEAALASGFLYEFWIFDSKRNLTIR